MPSTDGPIGFCGLGAMGFGMATNLVNKGYTVKGYDVFAGPVKRFAEKGGKTASTLKESAEGCMFYVCMVATAAQAQNAIFSQEGILSGAIGIS
jgi:3-hydroxyisobutyrate dehydrogenase